MRGNPLLSVSEEDRRIAPDAQDMPDAFRARIPTAFVCSLADVEMCDWNGKTWINYGIGDKRGFYYWAEAWYDGPMGELLENFFRRGPCFVPLVWEMSAKPCADEEKDFDDEKRYEQDR